MIKRDKEPWNIGAYIDNLTCPLDMLGEISVEHRSNNKKRDYLFLNKVQGKHYPASLGDTANMCRSLACKIDHTIEECEKGSNQENTERRLNILVIGFAETATALAKHVALSDPLRYYNIKYLQSTREVYEEKGDNTVAKVIDFEEEHSHATSHRIYFHGNISSFERVLEETDYIIFVDDEMTTGNTIRNLVNKLTSMGYHGKFIAAVICSWLNEEDTSKMDQLDIEVCSIISGIIKDTSMKLNVNILTREEHGDMSNVAHISPLKIRTNTNYLWNSRLIDDMREYSKDMSRVSIDICSMLHGFLAGSSKILVIGTEEFMWEPMQLASKISSLYTMYNGSVKFQATTISPIDVTTDKNSSITSRSTIVSNNGGYGYLYNLEKYDRIVVVFDREPTIEAEQSILKALEDAGNRSTNVAFVIM